MKLPRDVSGKKLIRVLEKLDYQKRHQKGSHIKMVREGHSITVPDHKEIKVGTLSDILKDVADNLSISMDDLLKEL